LSLEAVIHIVDWVDCLLSVERTKQKSAAVFDLSEAVHFGVNGLQLVGLSDGLDSPIVGLFHGDGLVERGRQVG
jgi:hypothetical protein